MEGLSNVIAQRNPNTIGINYSKHFTGDGLVKTDYEELKQNLPDSLTSRLISAEKLAIAWMRQELKNF